MFEFIVRAFGSVARTMCYELWFVLLVEVSSIRLMRIFPADYECADFKAWHSAWSLCKIQKFYPKSIHNDLKYRKKVDVFGKNLPEWKLCVRTAKYLAGDLTCARSLRTWHELQNFDDFEIDRSNEAFYRVEGNCSAAELQWQPRIPLTSSSKTGCIPIFSQTTTF